MTEKTTSGKWNKIAVIISVISLSISLGLTIYSFKLTEQANEISRKSLELEDILANYTSVIDAEQHAVGLLYASGFSFYPNGSIESFSSYGHLNFSLKVITPHYGNVSVEIVNFTADNSQLVLNTEKLNQTTVSYVWEDEKYHSLVVQGLNSLDASLELKGVVYPDASSLPAKGETIEFPIGWLNLNATLFDLQNHVTTTQGFRELIRVRVTVPYS